MFLKGKFLGQLWGRGAPNQCSQRSLVVWRVCTSYSGNIRRVCVGFFYDNFQVL